MRIPNDLVGPRFHCPSTNSYARYNTNGSCKHLKRANSQAWFQTLASSFSLPFPPLSLLPSPFPTRFRPSTLRKAFCIVIVRSSRNLIGCPLDSSEFELKHPDLEMKATTGKLRGAKKDESVTSSLSLPAHGEPHPGERIPTLPAQPPKGKTLRRLRSKILGLGNSDDDGKRISKINKAMIGPVTPADVSATDFSKMGALANYSRDNPKGEQRAYP